MRALEDIKKSQIPSTAIPISIGVSSLYTNIPHDEWLEAVAISLEGRSQERKNSLPDILLNFLKIVLTCNSFTFDGKYFVQKIGTAMGTKCAPPYANLFIGKFEEFALRELKHYMQYIHQNFWKRYLDDISSPCNGLKEC